MAQNGALHQEFLPFGGARRRSAVTRAPNKKMGQMNLVHIYIMIMEIGNERWPCRQLLRTLSVGIAGGGAHGWWRWCRGWGHSGGHCRHR